MLHLDLRPGSWPSDVTITATARGQAELPPELAGLEVRSAFYALEPAGVTFTEPAVAGRTLSMSALGFDPATSGVPLVLQAIRDDDGSWAWLSDQSFAWPGSDIIDMHGDLDHLGQLFGFGGTAFIDVEADPGPAVPVNEAFTLVITLRYDTGLDRDHRPAFVTPVAPFAPEGMVTFGDVGLTPADGTGTATVRIPIICDRAGLVPIGAEFDVSRMGAAADLLRELGLPDTTITVSAGVTVECVPPAP